MVWILLAILCRFDGWILWTLIPVAFTLVFPLHLPVSWPRIGRWHNKLLMFVLFGMFRVGETSNPGPRAHFDADSFTLGKFNPSVALLSVPAGL